MDSTSGQRVPHALVKLTTNSPRAALTDTEGKFQFEGLPAGSVTLEAGKPGYLGNNGFGSWSGTVYSFQFGPDAAPAILKLTPESVISGQVSDENGEPLEGFTITVLLRAPHDKRLYPDQSHSAAADDEGKFRIAGLHPGLYYLQVRQTQDPVLNATKEASFPSGYSPMFYPRANTPDSAVPVKVLPGKTVQANFSLKREPFIRLFGTVSGYNPQEQIVLMLWDSSGTPQNSEISFEPATGAFHTKWIPPGAYTLTAQSTGPIRVDEFSRLSLAVGSSAQVSVGLGREPTATFAVLHVNAASSLSGLHLALQSNTNIPVSVRIPPFSNPADQQSPVIQLYLFPKDNRFRRGIPFSSATNPETPSQISGDAAGVFAGVSPGVYGLTLAVGGSSDSYYLESATWGSVDLLRDDLVIESSGAVPPIELVFRDDPATLTGNVSLGDLPAQALAVLLAEKRTRTRFISVGLNGAFAFTGLPPGTYHVFAVDASAPFDYEDPASLARISSKIQEVTLAPKQSASVNLELVRVEE